MKSPLKGSGICLAGNFFWSIYERNRLVGIYYQDEGFPELHISFLIKLISRGDVFIWMKSYFYAKGPFINVTPIWVLKIML